MNRRYPLCAMLALSACVAPSPRPAIDAAAPAFDPIAFFSGRTEGDGSLRIVMSRARAVHIEGDGRIGADGRLTLVQRIEQQGKPARSRRWSIRPSGRGAYTGALSDAVGPVDATVAGNVMHLRFKARGGLGIEQWLALQPGGRSVRNHLVVRKLGMRAAVLDETIRKVD